MLPDDEELFDDESIKDKGGGADEARLLSSISGEIFSYAPQPGDGFVVSSDAARTAADTM